MWIKKKVDEFPIIMRNRIEFGLTDAERFDLTKISNKKTRFSTGFL